MFNDRFTLCLRYGRLQQIKTVSYHRGYLRCSGERRASVHRRTKGKSTIAGSSSASSPSSLSLSLVGNNKTMRYSRLHGGKWRLLPSLGEFGAGADGLVSAVPLVVGGHRDTWESERQTRLRRTETPRMSSTEEAGRREGEGRGEGRGGVGTPPYNTSTSSGSLQKRLMHKHERRKDGGKLRGRPSTHWIDCV